MTISKLHFALESINQHPHLHKENKRILEHVEHLTLVKLKKKKREREREKNDKVQYLIGMTIYIYIF